MIQSVYVYNYSVDLEFNLSLVVSHDQQTKLSGLREKQLHAQSFLTASERNSFFARGHVRLGTTVLVLMANL